MTWEGMRGIAQWLVVLLVAAALLGAWYAHHLWTQADRMLDAAVRAKLAEILPGWSAAYRRVSFDPSGRVTLGDLELTPAGERDPAVVIPRLTFELDPDALSRRQVLVHRILLERPEVILVRFADGGWNWERFTPPSPVGHSSPQWTIEGGRLRVQLYSDSGAPQELLAERIDLRGAPEAVRRYHIEGETFVEQIGRVSLKGLIDPVRGEWRISGRLAELRVSDELLGAAAHVVPGMADRLAQMIPARFGRERNVLPVAKDPLRFALAPEVGTSDARAAVPLRDATASARDADPVRAEIQLDFWVGRSGPSSPLDYEISAAVRNGQLSEMVVPIPLYNLSARVHIDPQQVRIEQLSASNGPSTLYLDGLSQRRGGSWDHHYQLSAANLQMDERIRGYLSPSLLHLYNQLQPSGTFDADLELEHAGGVLQSLRLNRFRAVNCRVVPQVFAYPVTEVEGEITQLADRYRVEMRGMAGDRPLSVVGSVGAGPLAGWVDLAVQVHDVPIDDMLIKAFRRPEQEGIRNTLTALKLRGLVDLNAQLLRRPGVDTELQQRLNLHLHDGELNFTAFPYVVERLSGDVVYDPLQRNAWIFRDLRGEHGKARIAAEGMYDLEQSPGMLSLTMSLIDVPVDHDLHAATITANPSLEEVWNDYGLSGVMDIERVQIGWMPESSPVISLYGIRWRNGTLQPAAVPYRWENVAGALQWKDNRLSIHSLQGWHNRTTYLHVDGSAHDQAAYIDFPEQGEVRWQLHLEDVKLVKLNPDDELRRALPAGVAQVVTQLDLQGPVDVQCGFDLKAWDDADETVTAQWAMTLLLDNNRLVAGLPLSGVTGKVEVLNGMWNGRSVDVDGYVELDAARTLNIPVAKVKGPFRVWGNRVIVGTPAFSEMPPPAGPVSGREAASSNAYLGKQLTAEVYGGRIGIDAEAVVDPNRPAASRYRADLKVEDAELAEWAKDQQIKAQRLRGKINGEVTLSGYGTDATALSGEGWVHLTPAELYELPVMAQLLSLIKGRPPDDTAFTYGYGDFRIRDGVFDFSRIELVGDALSLVGRGIVGFAGEKQSAVELDFYSRADSPVPLFRPIVEQFGSRWIRIQVVGTTSNPRALIQPRIPLLDDTFGGFMRALDAGRRPPPPRQRNSPPPSPAPMQR